jgi:hypothetical protein
MMKKGRFTVELVNAYSNTPFKEHTKDNETFVEAEPDAEYFVRIHVGVGALVAAKIFVDGKSLWYLQDMDKPERHSNYGLWYFDGVSTSFKALLFAKAKAFNSSDAAQEAPFWTGNVTVEFKEIFDTGNTHVQAPHQAVWKGGEVGIVAAQTGPKMKGVMTEKGNLAVSKKDDGHRVTYREGRILDTITLKYDSRANDGGGAWAGRSLCDDSNVTRT